MTMHARGGGSTTIVDLEATTITVPLDLCGQPTRSSTPCGEVPW
jgi:hypothetical protein